MANETKAPVALNGDLRAAFEAKRGSYTSELMTLPEIPLPDGTPVTVELRSLNMGQRLEFQKAARQDKAGNVISVGDAMNCNLHHGVFKPGTDEHIFQRNDLALLKELDAAPLERMNDRIMQMSGMVAEKGKDEAPELTGE